MTCLYVFLLRPLNVFSMKYLFIQCMWFCTQALSCIFNLCGFLSDHKGLIESEDVLVLRSTVLVLEKLQDTFETAYKSFVDHGC